jgi:hypothetical protein
MIFGSHDGSGQATRPVSLAMVTVLRAGLEAEVVNELVAVAMYTPVLTAGRYGRSVALVELVVTASCLSGWMISFLLNRHLELRELWPWHDGMLMLCSACLGPCLLFLSLSLTPTFHYTNAEQKSWILLRLWTGCLPS